MLRATHSRICLRHKSYFYQILLAIANFFLFHLSTIISEKQLLKQKTIGQQQRLTLTTSDKYQPYACFFYWLQLLHITHKSLNNLCTLSTCRIILRAVSYTHLFLNCVSASRNSGSILCSSNILNSSAICPSLYKKSLILNITTIAIIPQIRPLFPL